MLKVDEYITLGIDLPDTVVGKEFRDRGQVSLWHFPVHVLSSKPEASNYIVIEENITANNVNKSDSTKNFYMVCCLPCGKQHTM